MTDQPQPTENKYDVIIEGELKIVMDMGEGKPHIHIIPLDKEKLKKVMEVLENDG